jgi:hypothetical protein
MKGLFLFMGLFGLCGTSLGISAQTRVSIVGCYSDVTPIPEGEIVGNGNFRISKQNGNYRASFAELISDSGEQAAPVAIGNLRVNERTATISFDLPLNRGGHPVVAPHVFGKITKKGIKMYWRGDGGEYGMANPFLRRRTRNCN